MTDWMKAFESLTLKAKPKGLLPDVGAMHAQHTHTQHTHTLNTVDSLYTKLQGTLRIVDVTNSEAYMSLTYIL